MARIRHHKSWEPWFDFTLLAGLDVQPAEGRWSFSPRARWGLSLLHTGLMQQHLFSVGMLFESRSLQHPGLGGYLEVASLT